MLLTRILGGSLAAMGALCLVLYIMLQVEQRHSGKLEKRNAELAASVERQNEAVEQMRRDGEARQAAAAKALADAKRDTERAEVLASELERERPLSGVCRTPDEVMRAGL